VTLREIAKRRLSESGYDGLFNSCAGCACDLAGLMPCDEPSPDCEAGYKKPCPAECGEHVFHIAATREEA